MPARTRSCARSHLGARDLVEGEEQAERDEDGVGDQHDDAKSLVHAPLEGGDRNDE